MRCVPCGAPQHPDTEPSRRRPQHPAPAVPRQAALPDNGRAAAADRRRGGGGGSGAAPRHGRGGRLQPARSDARGLPRPPPAASEAAARGVRGADDGARLAAAGAAGLQPAGVAAATRGAREGPRSAGPQPAPCTSLRQPALQYLSEPATTRRPDGSTTGFSLSWTPSAPFKSPEVRKSGPFTKGLLEGSDVGNPTEQENCAHLPNVTHLPPAD